MSENKFEEVYNEFIEKLRLDPDSDYDTCLLIHRIAILHIRLKRIEVRILQSLDTVNDDGEYPVVTPLDLEHRNMEKRFMDIMKEVRKYVRKGKKGPIDESKPVTESNFDTALDQANRTREYRDNKRARQADPPNPVSDGSPNGSISPGVQDGQP